MASLAWLDSKSVLYTEALADCIEGFESNHNPLAYNPRDTDNREKFGLFQFGQHEWDTYCEGDKWNAEDQRKCFKKMIEAGYYRKWGTMPRCLTI